MAAMRIYSDWDTRSSDKSEQIEPYRKYLFICEGENTEVWYFRHLIEIRKELGINPLIDIQLLERTEEDQIVVIPVHTLFGEYPPKIPEDEIKPMAESGEIVLSRVVIPEYVVVHDGLPSDNTAPNYWVRYKDYIKNVASCEIYATWPEAALYANILAIMSFTLNRVYTEWYRGQGRNFTITSSTAYDQKFIYGRNIYENIDRLVDNVFANYLSRPGVRQPILTAYCDGDRVQCNGLSQWGSRDLAEQGYTAIEILRDLIWTYFRSKRK